MSKTAPLSATTQALLERLFGQMIDPDDDWNQAKQLVELCQNIPDIIRHRCEYNSCAHAEIAVLPSGKFFASGLRIKDYSLMRVGIGDPRVWHRTVRSQNLEVVSGCFTLAVVERTEDTATLLSIRQHRGCAVGPELWLAEKRLSEWNLTSRRPENELLYTLCSKLVDEHEPEDDPLWDRYKNVWVSAAMDRRFKDALSTTSPPTIPDKRKREEAIELVNEMEN